MTTGMNVGTTDAQAVRLIWRDCRPPVSPALAFDTGTTHISIPGGHHRRRRRAGDAGAERAADTPFIAITRTIIDEVTADQLRAVQRVVDQQEVLARETLRRGIPRRRRAR
jgi:purine catabolism regulator